MVNVPYCPDRLVQRYGKLYFWFHQSNIHTKEGQERRFFLGFDLVVQSVGVVRRYRSANQHMFNDKYLV